MVVGYLASAVLITLVIKRIELSIAYAIWAGLGVFLTTLIGIYFFFSVLGDKSTEWRSETSVVA